MMRVVGYPPGRDPGQFLDDYRRATRRARAVVERVFYGPGRLSQPSVRKVPGGGAPGRGRVRSR